MNDHADTLRKLRDQLRADENLSWTQRYALDAAIAAIDWRHDVCDRLGMDTGCGAAWTPVEVFQHVCELERRAALEAGRSGAAVAWLHSVVQDDGTEDQALSFAPDSFPLEGVGGFRSIMAAPLYAAAPQQPPPVGVTDAWPAELDWPDKPFTVRDEPGENDPCWLVLPGGESLALNHHARNGVDQTRAQFVADACNATRRPGLTDEADDVLRAMGLDPERFRTESGFLNPHKIIAAIKHPEDCAGLYLSHQQPAPSVSDHIRRQVGRLAQWSMCMSHNESYFGEPAGLVKSVTEELVHAVDPIYPPIVPPPDPLAGVTIYTARGKL